MDKKEYKLEKNKTRLEEQRQTFEFLKTALENPLIEFAAGLLFIGYLYRGKQSLLERYTGVDVMAGAAGVGLTGIITAQQLSKALPYIVQLGDRAAPLLGGLLK